MTALFGYELEFMVTTGEFEPAHDGPAYSPHALVPLDAFVADVFRDCAANGLELGQLHAEYGPAQMELSLAATDPVTAADRSCWPAGRCGRRRSATDCSSASPRCRPSSRQIEVWMGQPARRDPRRTGRRRCGVRRGPPARPPRRRRGDGAQPRFARAPATGLFRRCVRLLGGGEPEAPLRYSPGSPLLGAGHANMELKTSDASANPYLSLAAGAAGPADGLVLPPAVRVDPASLTAQDRAARGIAALPSTPAEQESALTGSRVADALGPRLTDAFLAVRRSDAAAAAGRELDDVLAGLRWRY